jgi:large subunit ribosomal protein L4
LPHRQKFGRQRAGTARTAIARPIFIGGGKPWTRKRDFDISLNKKIRALGTQDGRCRASQSGLVVVDTLDVADAKTKLCRHSSPRRTGARRSW